MTAAIWSTGPNACALDFPALTLIRFMHNHHLLQITNRPQWLTVKNGAKTYVESILKFMPSDRLHLNAKVSSVERTKDKVVVRLESSEEEFDHVILATHADTSLELLRDATIEEKEVLNNFTFSKNVATLHSDLSVCPQRWQG
jgi:predicted NAD/FAD-binding protein